MAISDKLNKLIITKEAIRNAIIDKGQPVSELDTFASYSDKISQIQAQAGEDMFIRQGAKVPEVLSPWTLRTPAADNNWQSVTYGNGLFVAVANSGTGNRVMTSPDGITWTLRTPAADNRWRSVTYGNGLFVAVANSGIGGRVMTSPDGITWTLRTPAADNRWRSVTYVAVS